jgi:WD40 repeat protein
MAVLNKNLLVISSRINALTIVAYGVIVSGSSDKTIKIWNSTDGSLINTLNGHRYCVNALTTLFNGNIVSCDEKEIIIWNR